MKRNVFAVTTVIFVIATVVLTVLLLQHRKTHTVPQDKYPLLAKRLFLEDPNDIIINFDPVRQEAKQYLESTGIPYSFYFEYLPTGSNIRVGETNELVGASLMKIPLVMNLYKAAESGKVKLDDQYTVRETVISTDDQYGNTTKLKVGDKITLREAAKITLTESDNTSAEVINAAIKDKIPEHEQAVQNLDVETTTKSGTTGKFVLISSRAYSSFLKCLYFSCYLSKEHSQEILTYLTESSEHKRLQAGIPAGIKVAHKIGSFSKFTQSDCGIVYEPNRQYVICLMLQAPADKIEAHFKRLSEIVYNYVHRTN